jgi:4'-phosphopantetheinyl transferase
VRTGSLTVAGLSADSVHVWRTETDLPSASLAQSYELLSNAEQRRAQTFRFTRDANRFIAGRAFVRRLLASYAGCAAARLEFTVGAFGKPALQPSAGIHFSVSHSAGLTVCVVSRAPVGVDIERIRDIPDALSIAQQFFSTTEAAALRDADASDISRRFLICWTRKEAVIKADGRGLSLPLNSFSVSVDPACPRVLDGESHARGATSWTLRNLMVDADYIASMATSIAAPEVRIGTSG